MLAKGTSRPPDIGAAYSGGEGNHAKRGTRQEVNPNEGRQRSLGLERQCSPSRLPQIA